MKHSRNHTIDALKLLFAFLIIAIHVQLFRDHPVLFSCTTQSLFRIGVPFYFIVSGYYFAGKAGDRETSRRYILRLLKIYAVFEAVDLLLTVPVMAYLRQDPLVILLRVLTSGVNGIYWYLISLILTCVLCRPLWEKKKTKHLIAAGLVLYLLAMTDDSYAGFFAGTKLQEIVHMHTLIWRWPQAGLAQSVLYLSLGVWLRQDQIRVKNPGLLFLFSTVLLVLEGLFAQMHGATDANCYFSLLAAAPLLFLWALEHPDEVQYPDRLRDLSLYVYMTHIYFTYITAFLPDIPRFLASAALASAVSFLIIRIRNRRINGGTT